MRRCYAQLRTALGSTPRERDVDRSSRGLAGAERGGSTPASAPPLALLIVGLGNPGAQYQGTRHNVGFRVVEALAGRHGATAFEQRFGGRYSAGDVKGKRVGFLLPETFMNASGESVAALLQSEPQIEPETSLVVVFDDLDLHLGRTRLRPSGGAGGHRGLASVMQAVDSTDVPRLRFGIGRPAAGQRAAEYVLGEFDPAELAPLTAGLERAADAIECWACEGMVVAMDRFNRRGES